MRDTWKYLETFTAITACGEVLLAYRGWRPGLLRHLLQRTGQHTPACSWPACLRLCGREPRLQSDRREVSTGGFVFAFVTVLEKQSQFRITANGVTLSVAPVVLEGSTRLCTCARSDHLLVHGLHSHPDHDAVGDPALDQEV